jgi:hypothetical protein
MSDPLRTIEDYELFLYTLKEQFPSVRHSTVIIARRGAYLARVSGELQFDQGFRLIVRERILYHRLPALIDEYGYEVWQGNEKLYWYDAQPHPDTPTLQSTYPHHKHIQPNMKNNRIPATGNSFNSPNLPGIIREIEGLIEKADKEPKSKRT